jgi:hypothetical protein
MSKKVTKKPSRKKYEESHPVFSARLDRDTYERLKEHLTGTGCSFAGFIKDSLGREESMIEKRVEMLASQKVEPSVEERLKYLEGLTNQIVTAVGSISPGEFESCVVACPRCCDSDLFPYTGKGVLTGRTLLIWKCYKCGFITRAQEPVDRKSLHPYPAGRISSKSWLEKDYIPDL